MFRLTIPLVCACALVGCAAVFESPALKISKVEDGEFCKLMIAVSVPRGEDRRGNYAHIAVTDRTGRIIERVDGSMSDRMFQAGYTRTMSFPFKARCADFVGVKVYSFSFMKPDGGLYRGYGRYTLQLDGLEAR